MTLGFPPDLNKVELSEAFLADFQKISDKPLPYEVVETGPVMENVIEGEAVDVTCFPTPVWHDRDEGRRYIGTGSFNVTRDPDERWVNAGTYRVMIHDAKRLGFYISPGKHGRIHRDKYEARNQPMPVCIVIGGDPLTFLMACTEVPYGICEFEIAGAYRGRPQKVVLGKHTGLPFPANAEIVIEGFVQPGNTLPEGPFGEWTGYYGSENAVRTGARHQGNLSPERPDHARLPAATAAGGAGALSRRDALGVAETGAEENRLARRGRHLVPRGRAARVSSRPCRSSSVIRGTPARPDISRPCAVRPPMPASMWSWSTTTSTYPISRS